MDRLPEKVDPQQVLQFLTTEHFTLQTARSATIMEANGRCTLFLATVSSGVVALALIGQVSDMGQSFFLFGLVLFPALLFLGIFTFERVLQICIEDLVIGCGINRIRHYYVELAPEVKPYFIRSIHDDMASLQEGMGVSPSRWQHLLTSPGMIGILNSILVGVFTGLLASFAVALSDYINMGLGIVIFGLSVEVHRRYQVKKFKEMESGLDPLFPSSPNPVLHKQPA
ncbi:hypothetical protein [Spirosoma arcticum]